MKENTTWVNRIKKEGYTVFDVDLDPKFKSIGVFDKGPYYGMETKKLFGD